MPKSDSGDRHADGNKTMPNAALMTRAAVERMADSAEVAVDE